MPAERLSMRRIREVLRLSKLNHSTREIARCLGIGRTTVSEYVRRARASSIDLDALDDQALEKALFVPHGQERPERPGPDWTQLHSELKRKHVTLALLWQEYKLQTPEGFQYSQFCHLYRQWHGTLDVWMRQEHRGGEKLFVDYSGDGIPWIDPLTGELHQSQLFVAALGASSYTFAEATESQDLSSWISAHVHALEFFGGVSRLIVPDQTRTAVAFTSRYEPEVNPTYGDFAQHYRCGILPARPRSPKDKAKVEAAVLVAQRWIIAALRNRVFHSIVEINRAVREFLEKLNNRTMRHLGRSRRELFLEVDLPNLRALPERPYEFAQWKIGARVSPDYHIEFQKHYYSVPHQLLRQEVDIRATASIVEIFHHHKRVASHLRSFAQHHHSTLDEHMPRSHQAHREWTPARIVNWAQKTGPSTAALVERIMAERPHPEQGFRACLGIFRLGKGHGSERLEKACARALACRSHSYRSVESTLKNRLEDQPLPQRDLKALPQHPNLRGSTYFHN